MYKGCMATEIERKFLLPNLDQCRSEVNFSYLAGHGMFANIRQGYLSFQPTVRVRISDYRNRWGNSAQKYGKDVFRRAHYTVKGPGLLSRQEFEYGIPVNDAEEMMMLCLGTIEKDRYEWEFKGHIFQIDVFSGKHDGLVLVEVELKSEDEVFEMPEWLKGAKEVTEDPRYTNTWLAVKGGVPARYDTPHDAHVSRVQNYCRKIEEWAQACMVPLRDDTLERHEWRRKFYEAYQFMYLAVKKSDCLHRLLYQDEELRTEQCPIHKGCWSGLHIDPCPEGCGYTGWLPNEGSRLGSVKGV